MTPSRAAVAPPGLSAPCWPSARTPPRPLSWPAEGGLTEAVGVLRAHARGHLAGDDLPAQIAARLAAAQYSVLLYDAAELGEVGIEMLQGLAMELSERRAASPSRSAAPVRTGRWCAGLGLAHRAGAAQRASGAACPNTDPWRFDAARQVAAGEVDAVLWLGAVPVSRPDWLSNVPSVALVADGEARAAEVVIAVGQPGRDHGGVLWNEQRAALTFWPALAPSDLPSAASVLGALKARLSHGPGRVEE
ncbi:hypothetical protein ACU4GA_19570 [Methylobacterium oryzae CBMB20]